MNDDKELLELAAKACGLGNGPYDFDPKTGWNTIENSSQALGLAIKLLMTIKIEFYGVTVQIPTSGIDVGEWGYDHEAATRRAITRAAAEIGKTL